MQFSKSLCGIAILVGPISFVLSALTFDQITNEVERLTGQVDDLISDINNINVATGDLNTNTIVTDYQTLASSSNTFNGAISGSPALTAAQQKSLINTLNLYTGRVSTLFEDTGSKAGDFEIPADQNEIQEAANSFSNANDALLGTIETLGKTLAIAVDEMRVSDDQADEDMNNDDAESPLRRKMAFMA